MKYFMLDIETMGVNMISDDIIQIGLLELDKDSTGYFTPNRSFILNLHTDQEPKDEWIRTNHAKLLEVCRTQPKRTPEEVRAKVLEFFKECGVDNVANVMGLNATLFDIPFMVNKMFLRPPSRDQIGKLVGDYHYRIYELRGAYDFAQDVLGLASNEFYDAAKAECPEIQLPEGQKHQALFDCYSQIKTLNGAIRLIRKGVSK